MASANPHDPYTYLGTAVLINTLGIRDSAALEIAERRFTLARRLELYDSPVKQTFDLDHLRSTHRHLFQDIYSWAGELRTVNISKGASNFHHASAMSTAEAHIFGPLASSSLLTDPGISDSAFAEQAGDLLQEINYMHPFREGNGRTQRAFLDDVAAQSGRVLTWRNVSPSENLAASVQAFDANSGAPLAELLLKTLEPARPALLLVSGSSTSSKTLCGARTLSGSRCRRRGICPFHSPRFAA